MLFRLQNCTAEQGKGASSHVGCQSTLQPWGDRAAGFTTILLQRKLNAFFFFKGEREFLPNGRHLNECTLSSLVGLACNLWNASQGRGLEWVSNRKFWAVYAYITFLSHPEKEWSTNTTSLCLNKEGVEGGYWGGERPGHRLHRVQKQMWLLRIQTSFSPRKRT